MFYIYVYNIVKAYKTSLNRKSWISNIWYGNYVVNQEKQSLALVRWSFVDRKHCEVNTCVVCIKTNSAVVNFISHEFYSK